MKPKKKFYCIFVLYGFLKLIFFLIFSFFSCNTALMSKCLNNLIDTSSDNFGSISNFYISLTLS